MKSANSESSPTASPSNTERTARAKSRVANDVKSKRSGSAAAKVVNGAQTTMQSVIPVVLKSGRTTTKPLEWWRGEQIIYQPPQRLGKELLPGGYSSIDPGRNAIQDPLRLAKRRVVKRPARVKAAEVYEDIDEDQEEWEREGPTPGVLNAGVFVWDPETQNRIENAHEEIGEYTVPLLFRFSGECADGLQTAELALAPIALNEKTQWAKGNTFKFGKTLTLPFFHSGIVDLPPGGEKRPKNSRKNHMIFWVFSGRVQVDVSGNVFSVGRGGMWQVPRGRSKARTFPCSTGRVYCPRWLSTDGCLQQGTRTESLIPSIARSAFFLHKAVIWSSLKTKQPSWLGLFRWSKRNDSTDLTKIHERCRSSAMALI